MENPRLKLQKNLNKMGFLLIFFLVRLEKLTHWQKKRTSITNHVTTTHLHTLFARVASSVCLFVKRNRKKWFPCYIVAH